MSQGASRDAARRALEEAVHFFLATAADMGTLEDVLQESGYARDGDKWNHPGPLEAPGKVFIKAGFRLARQEGSHRSYVKPGVARPVVIPTYEEVGVAIIRNNVKTAGLSRDQNFHLLEES
jgi:predicted RNA binding protein YcfA (HicA-like mRNA interferase family)